MRGGSYMVTRRIRMLIEVWDRASLDDQQQTIGREKDSGAPLGRQAEFDAVPLGAHGSDGKPVVPVDAHIRLAAPSTNEGVADPAPRVLLHRRHRSRAPDSSTPGSFFICFQRDPRTQFVPLQHRLASKDALNEYIKHVGSAIFAVPPGAQPGGFVGETLFA